MDTNQILTTVVRLFKEILKDNLVGVYLHGSLAMGCCTNTSDIDILVVVNHPLTFSIKRHIIDGIIVLEALPEKGLEMSIVLKKHTRDFVYPTPFELHYSDFHQAKYLHERDYICVGRDRDLAAHITVINQRGICLFGEEIHDVFGCVPRDDFLNAILFDIENVKTKILIKPVYYILNLCRILLYLKEGSVSSKLEGGKWGMENVSPNYIHIIEMSLQSYMQLNKDIRFNQQELSRFADYMMVKIESNLK